MPPKKRRYKRKNKNFFHPTNLSSEIDLDVSPDTIREILGVFLIVLGLVFLLAALNLAGSLGGIVYLYTKLAIGWSSWFLPFIFTFFGIGFLYPQKILIRPSSIIGVLIFITAFSSLLHLFFTNNVNISEIKEAVGGGYLGYFINLLFYSIFGFWASMVIFLGMIISSFLLTFNTTTSKLKEIFDKYKEERQVKEPNVVVNQSEEFKPETKTITKKEKEVIRSVPEIEISHNAIADKNWEFPSLDFLSISTNSPDSGNIKENVKIIERTLKNFGVVVEMVDVNVGPTVTQYTLKPNTGVKLNKITALSNDLALALAAHPIRIEAPIPGKSLVGIEIPNKAVSTVRLRRLLEEDLFQKRKSNLTVALGRDVSGSAAYASLDSMPHLLIAGSTGSGKSVSINSILISLLYQNSPRDLKILLIDPKRVELSLYNGIPHLLTEVVTEVDKTVNSLKWMVSEMERRYRLLQQYGYRDIKSYNHAFKKDRLPYIVIVIDELADLMSVAANEVEGAIVRLAQMARAVGIHLVVATQRPSVDVITGLIKANITTRIAFAVASQVDSRTILDMAGAEKLLGKGDMLYLSADLSKPKRIQGVFISDEEAKKVADFLKGNEDISYNNEITEKKYEESSVISNMQDDPLFMQAVETVIQARKASATLLQRRFRLGYARAARLLDILEQKGIVSPADGSKPRDVLISDIAEIKQEEEPDQEEGVV